MSGYWKTNKAKLIKTFFCYVSFFGLGSCCTLLGSSLLDLSIKLNASFSQVSNLVPARSIGYLIGGVLSCFTDKLAGPDMILFVTNFTAGVFIALAPWFKNFSVVFVLLLLSGISQGTFDIYANSYTLLIWGNKATNYVQILHGCFGLGSLLTPLMVKPFLLPLIQDQTNETQSDDVLHVGYTPDDVLIQYPYVVVGVILVFASSGFLVFHFKERSSEKDVQSIDSTPPNDHPTWKIFASLIALALTAHATFGVETLVGSLAPSFAVLSNLKMTKKEGADLVTVFWALFTFYRIVFIAAQKCIKERYMMYFSFILMMAAIILMCLKPDNDQLFVWISIILLGTGFAPTFSVCLGLLQKYINISNKYASFIFIAGSSGEAIHPWVVSKVMESMPVFFMYYTAVVSFVQLLLCFLLPFIFKAIFSEVSKRPLHRSASIRSSQR